MNKTERTKMVMAMEYIVRNLNDEELIMPWLSMGVADGDIQYGDLTVTSEKEEELEYYTEDVTFADLMDRFLRLMFFATKYDSGLYCDGIVSKKEED